jgi:hypothetical protein
MHYLTCLSLPTVRHKSIALPDDAGQRLETSRDVEPWRFNDVTAVSEFRRCRSKDNCRWKHGTPALKR